MERWTKSTSRLTCISAILISLSIPPKRPYSDTVDIVAHDEWLLDLWYSTVDKRDTVYILGDLTFLKSEEERRFYLHETFLTEKIPEIAAYGLARGSSAASPQSLGKIAKILQSWIKSK